MPTITVPDDTYHRLAARAAALNTTVDALAAPTLARLARDDAGAAPALPLAGEAWREAFAALNAEIESRADRYPPGHVLDTDRDAAYRDREDAQL